MRLSGVLFVFLVVVALFAHSADALSLVKKGAKKPGKKSSSGSGSAASGSAATAAQKAEEKSDEKAQQAAQIVQANTDDERIANQLLNGQVPTEKSAETAEALNQLNEQTMCTNEMRSVAIRNSQHPDQTHAARSRARATDVIVPLPRGTDALQGLLAIHSDMVKAGCRIVDHWCAYAHCFFRSCFCMPVTAEQPKRPIVQGEVQLAKNNQKLANDAQLVKEGEIKAEDKGKEGKARKLEKTEKKVEKKMEKNKNAEKKLQKAEEKIDTKAAKAETSTACPVGYRLITSSVQPFCKKAVFQGATSFEQQPGTFIPQQYPAALGMFGGY